MSEAKLDITIDEIARVAQATVRGQSLKNYAGTIRQLMDEAITRFSTLDAALQIANTAHEVNGLHCGVLPEDRKVVEAGDAYELAETRLLRAMLAFVEDGSANSGGLTL